MADLLELYRRLQDRFGELVHSVGSGDWERPTPCAEWDVRDLVRHLVGEQLWASPLLGGESVDEVGDRFAGDPLGDDPVAAWEAAAHASRAAVTEAGALDRTVRLSRGPTPARDYVEEMTFDLLVHGWDLARGLGSNTALDADAVDHVLARMQPRAAGLASSGLFAEAVDVPADADPQTRLLALTGRRP